MANKADGVLEYAAQIWVYQFIRNEMAEVLYKTQGLTNRDRSVIYAQLVKLSNEIHSAGMIEGKDLMSIIEKIDQLGKTTD